MRGLNQAIVVKNAFDLFDHEIKFLLYFWSYFALIFEIFIFWNGVHPQAKFRDIIRRHFCADSQGQNSSGWRSNHTINRSILMQFLQSFKNSNIWNSFSSSTLKCQIKVTLARLFVSSVEWLLVIVLYMMGNSLSLFVTYFIVLFWRWRCYEEF